MILRALTAFFLLSLVGTANAQNRYQATLESAYDGDTITVQAHTGQVFLWDDFWIKSGREFKLRIVGVDTPEIKGKCQAEKELAVKARDFTINTLIARDFEIELTGKMTFSRWLARVYVDGVDLADLIIAAGLGRENYGETRLGWC